MDMFQVKRTIGVKRSVLAASLGIGLLFSTATPAAMSAAQAPVYSDMGGIRGLVDRTQADLRTAAELEHRGHREHDRYRDAQKNLSDFDRHLTKGSFDRGKLDHCIDQVKSILDHNTLQASSRDALLHDLEDLHIARERFGH